MLPNTSTTHAIYFLQSQPSQLGVLPPGVVLLQPGGGQLLGALPPGTQLLPTAAGGGSIQHLQSQPGGILNGSLNLVPASGTGGSQEQKENSGEKDAGPAAVSKREEDAPGSNSGNGEDEEESELAPTIVGSKRSRVCTAVASLALDRAQHPAPPCRQGVRKDTPNFRTKHMEMEQKRRQRINQRCEPAPAVSPPSGQRLNCRRCMQAGLASHLDPGRPEAADRRLLGGGHQVHQDARGQGKIAGTSRAGLRAGVERSDRGSDPAPLSHPVGDLALIDGITGGAR